MSHKDRCLYYIQKCALFNGNAKTTSLEWRHMKFLLLWWLLCEGSHRHCALGRDTWAGCKSSHFFLSAFQRTGRRPRGPLMQRFPRFWTQGLSSGLAVVTFSNVFDAMSFSVRSFCFSRWVFMFMAYRLISDVLWYFHGTLGLWVIPASYSGQLCKGFCSMWESSKIEVFQLWLVWLSGLSAGLWTKGLLGGFPVRARAWVQARSPVGAVREATAHWCFSPSLSPSFPLSLKINK